MKYALLFLLTLCVTALNAQRIEWNGDRLDTKQTSVRYDDDISLDVIFYEGFENAQIPSLPRGWVTLGLENDRFRTGTAGKSAGQTNANGFWNVPLHGIFAFTNDDVCNCNKSQDRLVSPTLNLQDQPNVTLIWSSYHDGSAGQKASLEIRSASNPWTPIFEIPSGAVWKTFQVKLPQGFLEDGFQFRFRYDDQGNYASGLAVDDIYLFREKTDRFALNGFFTINGVVSGSGQLYDQIPRSQAREAHLQFGGLVENDANTAKNALLNVVISGPLSFSDSSSSWFLKEKEMRTISFDHRQTFTPYQNGTYTLLAELMTDSVDEDAGDNSFNSTFSVGDSSYRRTAIPSKNTTGIWLEDQGDRFGSVFHLFQGDTLRAVKVRIHPSTQAGARMRFKVFSTDTLTSSSYSSPLITVTEEDIGRSIRIPLNIRVSKGRQVFAFEKESGTERLVLGANPNVEAEPGNALIRPASQAWNDFPLFPLMEVIIKPVDSVCSGHIQFEVNDESCANAADGSVSTQVFDANIPFTFNWSNGAGNVDQIDNLEPGFYNLFVIDAQNCIYERNFEVEQADSIQFLPVTTLDTCERNTGRIDLQLSGGNAPYTIEWNGVQRGEIESSLAQGTYNIHVVDESGCENSTTVTLGGTVDVGIAFSITPSTCGDSVGHIEITPFGTGPFQIQWNQGDTSLSLDSIPSGIYEVTLSDSLGCSTTGRAFVNDINAPSLGISNVTNIDCYGAQDGAIEVSVGGDPSSHIYAWSTGDTTKNIDGLDVGSYLLSVTDTAGCKAFISASVENLASPVLIDLNERGNYCYDDSTGVAEILVTGGALPFSFDWSTGEISKKIEHLAAGTYYFTVTDDLGCTFPDSVQISNGGFFAAQVDSVFLDTANNIFPQNKVFVEVIGGTSPISYLWNDSISGKNLIDVPVGFYNLIATDQLGCKVSLDYLIENGPAGIFSSEDIQEVSLYPNPLRSGETLWVKSSSPIEGYRLLNLSGQSLIEKPTTVSDQIGIDLGALPSGMYLLQTLTLRGIDTERILILP